MSAPTLPTDALAALTRRIAAAALAPAPRVLLAYSGGLDSTLCVELLRRCYATEDLRLVLFDVGQGEHEIARAVDAAAALGVGAVRVIDVRAEIYEEGLATALRANAALRGYPIAAPIVKQRIAAHLARIACAEDVAVIAEGSSGKGNDQFRMSAPIARHAPELRVVAPIRDLDLSRRDEEALCDAWGVPYPTDVPSGGDDVTQWCRSIASGSFDLDAPLPHDVWMWYRDPEDQRYDPTPLVLRLTFVDGVPRARDGIEAPLLEIVRSLNAPAGARGIGKVDVIEDGILGLKSREIYEAPGATVLLAAHRDLEHLCLTKEELEFKASVDARWTQLMYEADAAHPLVDALEAFLERVERNVVGEVELRLAAGRVDVLHRSSERSLYARALRHLDARAIEQPRMEGAVLAHDLAYRALAERDARARTGSWVPAADDRR